jgi:hypothetical protein
MNLVDKPRKDGGRKFRIVDVPDEPEGHQLDGRAGLQEMADRHERS